MSIGIARTAVQRLPHPPRKFPLVAEVDMLDEHDLAVIVFDDVVAVEPIAVLISEPIPIMSPAPKPAWKRHRPQCQSHISRCSRDSRMSRVNRLHDSECLLHLP